MSKLRLKALTLAAPAFLLGCGTSQEGQINPDTQQDADAANSQDSQPGSGSQQETPVKASPLQHESANEFIDAFESAASGTPLTVLALFPEIDHVMQVAGAEVDKPTELPLMGVLTLQSKLDLPACVTVTDTSLTFDQCQLGPATVDGEATLEDGHLTMDLSVVYDGADGECSIHMTHDYTWSDTSVQGVSCFEKESPDQSITAAAEMSIDLTGQSPGGTVEASATISDSSGTVSKGVTLTLDPNGGDASVEVGAPTISCADGRSN